jgi:eukaryotic-like serine/threonine-protein kinase
VPANDPPVKRSMSWLSLVASVTVLAWSSMTWSSAQTVAAPIRQLTLFDRQGNVTGTVGAPGVYAQPSFSPDGTRIAVTQGGDVWVLDVNSGTRTQMTATPDPEGSPVWSADGSRIAFRRTGASPGFVFTKSSTGDGPEEQHGQLPGPLTDWSKDGRFLLGSYDASQTPTKGDLFLLPLAGPIRQLALLATPATENGGHFSFDGRFVAYRSDESGRGEIYVRPFDTSNGVPSLGNPLRVSSEGALGTPRWRKDNREIYYLSQGGEWAAVAVTLDSLKAGVPTRLFRPPDEFVNGTPGPTASSDVSADGQRFVLLLPRK